MVNSELRFVAVLFLFLMSYSSANLAADSATINLPEDQDQGTNGNACSFVSFDALQKFAKQLFSCHSEQLQHDDDQETLCALADSSCEECARNCRLCCLGSGEFFDQYSSPQEGNLGCGYACCWLAGCAGCCVAGGISAALGATLFSFTNLMLVIPDLFYATVTGTQASACCLNGTNMAYCAGAGGACGCATGGGAGEIAGNAIGCALGQNCPEFRCCNHYGFCGSLCDLRVSVVDNFCCFCNRQEDRFAPIKRQ